MCFVSTLTVNTFIFFVFASPPVQLFFNRLYPEFQGRFPFVLSGRPKITGSGQFIWKDPMCIFSRHNSPNSRALADRSERTERL